MYLGKESLTNLTNPPAFQAEQTWTTTSSVLTGNGRITNYNVERLDNYNAFSSGVFTVPITGLYFFIFCISDSATSLGDIYIRKNGSTVGFNLVTRHSGNNFGSATSTVVECNVNDAIDAYLDYSTTRNNYCRYQFGGFMKRSV